MRKSAKKREATKAPLETLKGWQQIAAFLGEPTSVVQRWASDGMPVRKQGRYVETTPDELNAWLGKESGKPVRVATKDTERTPEGVPAGARIGYRAVYPNLSASRFNRANPTEAVAFFS